MKNNLGEIFYDGRIVNLNGTSTQELQNILTQIRNEKVGAKEKIEEILEKMRNI